MTLVLSFALVLFIEKIATDHHHGHSDEEERKIRKTILQTINRDYSELYHEGEGNEDHDHEHHHQKNVVHASNLIENPDDGTNLTNPMLGKRNEDDEDEEAFKNVMRVPNKIAKQMSFIQNVKKSVAMDRIYFLLFFLL